jgi:enoyl-[acyl-carrier-protein] reductase (NADH)
VCSYCEPKLQSAIDISQSHLSDIFHEVSHKIGSIAKVIHSFNNAHFQAVQ